MANNITGKIWLLYTSPLPYSAKGVKHLMVCWAGAHQIIKWSQPKTVFIVTCKASFLTFFSRQRHQCLHGQPLGCNSSDRKAQCNYKGYYPWGCHSVLENRGSPLTFSLSPFFLFLFCITNQKRETCGWRNQETTWNHKTCSPGSLDLQLSNSSYQLPIHAEKKHPRKCHLHPLANVLQRCLTTSTLKSLGAGFREKETPFHPSRLVVLLPLVYSLFRPGHKSWIWLAPWRCGITLDRDGPHGAGSSKGWFQSVKIVSQA